MWGHLPGLLAVHVSRARGGFVPIRYLVAVGAVAPVVGGIAFRLKPVSSEYCKVMEIDFRYTAI